MPLADDSLIPIPFNNHTNNATKELDYLMISDIFTTSGQALTYSGFEPGDSVAVFGAGPVGLLAAYSALLRGASRASTPWIRCLTVWRWQPQSAPSPSNLMPRTPSSRSWPRIPMASQEHKSLGLRGFRVGQCHWSARRWADPP